MLRHIAIACALLTMLSSVSAHEGHGDPEHPEGILHYFVNPSHAIPGVVVCIVALTAAFFIRKALRSHSEKLK